MPAAKPGAKKSGKQRAGLPAQPSVEPSAKPSDVLSGQSTGDGLLVTASASAAAADRSAAGKQKCSCQGKKKCVKRMNNGGTWTLVPCVRCPLNFLTEDCVRLFSDTCRACTMSTYVGKQNATSTEEGAMSPLTCVSTSRNASGMYSCVFALYCCSF